MSGDVHVRFCESAGVQFPRATHHLHAYETVAEARLGIAGYVDFYNRERPHSSLDKQTPDEAYYQQPALQAA